MMRIARSRIVGWFVCYLFAKMSFVIPVKRLRETKTLIAFYHPQPSHDVHILLVPKKAVKNFSDLSTEDTDFLTDLVNVVKSLVLELELEEPGYRLVVNGGLYQDIPQLHFHLISGDD